MLNYFVIHLYIAVINLHVIFDEEERLEIVQQIHKGNAESIQSKAIGGHIVRTKTVDNFESYAWFAHANVQ